MAAPTARIRTIPLSTEATAINTAGKRTGSISGQAVVSTGSGNEANFGTVDISAGAANSDVLMMLMDFTADGGNSVVEDFKLWLSASGFDMEDTALMYAPLSGSDQTGAAETENYQKDASDDTYSFTALPDSEPGSQNLFPSDEGSSMDLDTTSDDALMWAWYLAVASGETTGTYKGTDTGNEFRATIKYSYS
jgi:hypothetical protein